jgi:thiamine-phosphate pyrophosphorylase
LGALGLCLVTDRHATRGRDLVAVVAECVDAGLRLVQVRDKDLPSAALLALCGPIRELTRRAGARLFVNSNVEVALEVGADGVHRPHALVILPEDAPGLGIAVSIHRPEEAVDAQKDGAEFVVFGPVWDTPSKRAFGPPQGLERLAEAVRAVSIPVFAIGGVTPERVPEVRAAGAAGVAVVSAILSADSPGTATRRFLEVLA